MYLLGMQQKMKMKRHDHHQKRCNKKGVKVVYISSPMKVETCASNFRALVQELTGKDSDAASRLADFEKSPKISHHHHHHHHQESIGGHDQYLMRMSESPTFSDAVMEPIYGDGDGDDDDDVFRSHRDGSFLGMFSSIPFSESFQLDHHASCL
ncbi:hypothetical protein ACOSQ4_032268 [Xanthoceras sorbifolium]